MLLCAQIKVCLSNGANVSTSITAPKISQATALKAALAVRSSLVIPWTNFGLRDEMRLAALIKLGSICAPLIYIYVSRAMFYSTAKARLNVYSFVNHVRGSYSDLRCIVLRAISLTSDLRSALAAII